MTAQGDERKITLPEMLEMNWKGEASQSEQCSLYRCHRHKGSVFLAEYSRHSIQAV